MEISAVFNRKLGPLPAWGWIVILTAVSWGWYYVTKREAGPDSISDSGTPGDSASDATSWDEYFGAVDHSGMDTVGSGTGGSAVTPGSTMPTDNQAWYTQAGTYLASQGYEGVAISNALTRYLNGTALVDLKERALVSIAIARFGVPPEGVPVNNAPPPVDPNTPGTNPPTTPKPGPTTPKPSAGRYVTIASSGQLSTLWGIAEKYYGSGSAWTRIWSHPQNASIRAKRGSERNLHAGDRFWVPGA